MKIKTKIKRLFCRHRWEACREIRVRNFITDDTIYQYLKCKKCGKIIPMTR